MNIKEELKKSVPYKSLKNVQKKSYDHSSDENDLEMGFPIQENIHAYNILKDQRGLSKIKNILEGSELQEYNQYEHLTVFEELAMIMHFSRHQNDTTAKKIKQLSQKLGRDEKFLNDYIEDIGYFQRYNQINFDKLIKKLIENTEQTLISRIKWKKQPSSNYNYNSKKNSHNEYDLEIIPNNLKNNNNDQNSNIIEKQSVNSEQIYLEGQNSFSQKEQSQFFFQQETNGKFFKTKEIFQNKVKQLRKNPVNSYFDSDSQDNEENNFTQLNKRSQNIEKSQPFTFASQYNKNQNYQNSFQRQQQSQQSEDDSEESYQQDQNSNQNKKRNSLNAFLTKVIQFESQSQSESSEVNEQELEFQKFPFDLMLCDGIMSLNQYQQCIENIQKNQQLTVKQFLQQKN